MADGGVHKKTASWQKEQMVMTRAQRRAEVVMRCSVAVAQLSAFAEATGLQQEVAGQYRINLVEGWPEAHDLGRIIWLLSFVTLSASRAGPPDGPWVEQERAAILACLTDEWMEVHKGRFPTLVWTVLTAFWQGRRMWGEAVLLHMCQERIRPTEILMRLGYRLVEGGCVRRMVRNAVIIDVNLQGPEVDEDPWPKNSGEEESEGTEEEWTERGNGPENN